MTSPVAIRTASSEDRDGVSHVLESSYPVLMDQAYDTTVLKLALPFMTVAQPSLLKSGNYYVAETTDGSMVGCGGWSKERPGSDEVRPGLGHVRHFGVHPNWARQGIGLRIYRRCVEDAKSAGLDRLECYSSLNGEPFYSALGFKSLGRIELEMSEGVIFPSIRMLAEI
jgi:ribosomal protein S18 acetylase RimI-like enzyme